MEPPRNPAAEWLEADGLGGFASGTVSGTRTRRYHALLLTATTPPTGRFVLVNGFDALLETPGGVFPLSSQAYAPGVLHPDGARRIERFDLDPWPRWRFRLEDGTWVVQEIFVPQGGSVAALSWRIEGAVPAPARLHVRPFFSGRDFHSLHRENPVFRFEPETKGERLLWRPYPGIPRVAVLSNAVYAHQPEWYRNFLYEEERRRGLDFVEDLASPGIFRWDLTKGEAAWIIAAEGYEGSAMRTIDEEASALGCLRDLRSRETRRRGLFPSPLHRSADAYLVRRGEGKTIVAGYPWFTDWGRDTFIALRGLCLATGRLEVAGQILVEWASAVSEGMLPNLFPEGRSAPEYNSVDASLWYVIAVDDFLRTMKASGKRVKEEERRMLQVAVDAILEGYSRGTRYGIRADVDGLLAAGVPGMPLTWLDARVGDWAVTPRIGKPVEIQALWLNALRVGGALSEGGGGAAWAELFDRGRASFPSRFWNEEGGCLHDVVDVDDRPGAVDASFRPNQILAVGGLPFPLLERDRARRVVNAVEGRLLTPLGLRTLAPGEPGYAPRYEGGPLQRDGSYHQGTVWPWLIGPFVEAWVRVRGGGDEVCREARSRFLEPLLRHLDEAGLGHISEIADGDPPHTPRGCPFQAWSMGEAIRLANVVLAESQDFAP